ncbi:hypothetical protein [Anabaena azotica]|uniref:Uncharacterized protein n=1 Tax=Anabaena azotica FACHB-119 TaxID=947527 RepID=A0ABR8DHJ7_9NOST|nr:hypothetical protein [Anabaena azotica]MBD2505657.1 hypothetical protein [Anabaena azotica FACHB-119]
MLAELWRVAPSPIRKKKLETQTGQAIEPQKKTWRKKTPSLLAQLAEEYPLATSYLPTVPSTRV